MTESLTIKRETKDITSKELFVRNVVEWASENGGFEFDGFRWFSEKKDGDVFNVWGVSLSSGVRMHEAWLTDEGDFISYNGDKGAIYKAFTSQEGL